MSHKISPIACCISLAFLANTVSAQDIDVSGFASFRAGQIFDTEGENPQLPNLYNNDEINFKDESLVGLQLSKNFTDKIDFTLQFTTYGRKDWDIETSWAYLSYKITPNHIFNMGRFVNPIFNNSETQSIGYSHNWSRLPKSVYRGQAFDIVDGIKLNSFFEIAGLSLETKLVYARWDGDVYIPAAQRSFESSLKNLIVASGNLSGDWWKLFGGVVLSEMDNQALDSTYIAGIANKLGANAVGATADERQEFDDAVSMTKDANYLFAGFGVDYQDWLVDYEHTEYQVINSVGSHNYGWYFSLGRRFNDLTVSLSRESFKQEADHRFAEAISNPILKKMAIGISDAFAVTDQDTNVLSVRYDVRESAALKFDLFVGDDARPTVGTYKGFSLGLDLVF